MSTALRLALFAALLGVIFGAATLAGAAIDPDRDESESAGHGESEEAHGTSAAPAPRGLASVAGDLRLIVDDATLERGRRERFRFRVVRGDETVRDFDLAHERRMHFIVVRRDLSGFRHLHPRQLADGSWEVDLTLDEAGSYRVYADFERDGENFTLAGEVSVAGRFAPRPLPAPSDRAGTQGGYEVRRTDHDGELSFAVTRDGERIRDLQPYLGARGHLVVLREGDLAFLHVHPESAASAGSETAFAVDYPSSARYRLYLQFKHEGRVRTAQFTTEHDDADR